MSRRVVRLGLVVTLALTAAVVGVAPASAGSARTIVVHPGESIQWAVNHAEPGDTIKVQAGVYHQSVLVRHTNDLTLEGPGAGNTAPS